MKIEITIRDIRHISELIDKITQLNPSQLNITDKNGLSDNLLMIETVKGTLPGIDYVPHYSFKNHTSKDKDVIIDNYTEFLLQAEKAEVSEILLLSGSPRPKLDTIEGLRLTDTIIKDHSLNSLKFAVAYNPFLQGEELEDEKRRLNQKLEFERVDHVYLQMGTLVHPFRAGVQYVQSLNPNILITPSIIIPSKAFLTKFRFRPWKGVVLDDKYLANLKNANQKTRDLLVICNELGLDPLLEFISLQFIDIDEFNKLFGDLVNVV